MRAYNDNALLRVARRPPLYVRLIDRALIIATLVCLGGLVGSAAFGN
jgi:hypothetical protein